MDSAAPTVRSFSAEFEPLRLIAQRPDLFPGLFESSGSPGITSSGEPFGERVGARFDILPMSSGECLRLDNHGSLSGPHAGTDGFLGALDRWWRSLQSPRSADCGPFTGGWLLYLGYELAVEIEPRLHLPASSNSVCALAIRTPAAWIRDRVSGKAWLVAEPGSERLLDEFTDFVARLPAASRQPRSRPNTVTVREEDPDRFLHAVRRSLDYIAAGDVYQTNLSREWSVQSQQPLDPVVIYARLRSTNPSPFAAMMQYRGFSLMSSSPERLFSIRDGTVSTRPIAGTRPRDMSLEKDAALAQSLLSNDKERAEHVMLIDLGRNDLGRICVAGSVQVDEYMSIETYAHVHHIVSNVRGRLAPEVTPVDAIRALFPGGTITGCPKVRCMEIIAELEGSGRGAYTGSIGYLNRDGDCDLNILIRTLTADVVTDASGAAVHTLSFRAGAGIVADSIPVQELAETRAKAKGLLRALEPFA